MHVKRCIRRKVEERKENRLTNTNTRILTSLHAHHDNPTTKLSRKAFTLPATPPPLLQAHTNPVPILLLPLLPAPVPPSPFPYPQSSNFRPILVYHSFSPTHLPSINTNCPILYLSSSITP